MTTNNSDQTDPHSAKTVLVTGASGFIGRSLVGQLATNGFRLRVCSRSPHRPAWLTRQAEYHRTAGDNWQEALRGVHTVIHLAAVTNTAGMDEAQVFSVNAGMTHDLAEQAVAAGVRRFLFLSSIKVHGEDSGGTPFRVTDAPAPSDIYARSKLEAEKLLVSATAGSDTESVIIRPTLVYGPGVEGNLARLMGLIDRGLPLPLGAVHNRRQLTALTNLCDLIRLCIDHPQAGNNIFLAADLQAISTVELVTLLARTMHRPARLWSVPTALLRVTALLTGRRDELRRLTGNLQVDLEYTIQTLGWSPSLSTAQGIAQLAAIPEARPAD